ncbi:MAG: glycosyltransferase [Candidatus Acidiferrales bacterium]
MPDRRYRVLIVGTHPVQFMPPTLREFARHPQLDIQVAYCSLQGAEPGLDPGFGIEVQWNIPMLEGYPWILVPNRSPRPRLEHFWGLLNTGLWKLLRDGRFDAAVALTGYLYASFWILVAAARRYRVPLLFGTDATSLKPRSGQRWRVHLKRFLLPKIFGMASVVIVPSNGGVDYIRSLGIPASRIVMTPMVVDNHWWHSRAAQVDRGAVRRSWGVPEDAPVALFCAKLRPWKRPHDTLRAFVRAGVKDAYLVFVGVGPLRDELGAEAKSSGVEDRVRFLGFVNQSGLPAVYRASDLLVLPSDYDPCPIIIPEAMACGCPTAISDEIRGRFDLVRPGKTGFIFPCGNIEALSAILREALSNSHLLREFSQAALKRMETWTIRDNVTAMVEAISKACGDRK